jgi:TolB-like protein/DNA-binding winged helix-turn-helix (wHTH) protein
MPNAAPGTASRSPLRFGVFELDTQAQELRKSGMRIKLQPQPLRILSILLEKSGEVVFRDELREKLWPSETYVEFDRSLSRAVVKLREALGDSAESPRFIETLPKRGYRFIAPVNRSPVPQLTAPTTLKRKPRFQLLAVAAIIFSAILVGHLAMRRIRGNASSTAIRSLVVLPFENLSADPGEEYFADGMTDELTTDLAKIRSLRIVSRTTAMHYKGTSKELPQIARELGVDAVVEGSISRSEDKIRIRAQLVRGATDRHVWANSYERNLTDAVALQAEVARDIAAEIEINLSPQEKTALAATRKTVNPAAYEAYLKGKYFYEKRTAASDQKSIEHFRQAIDMDPNFAAAYAGLAGALVLRSYLGDASPPEVMPESKELVGRALTLDDSLIDAHITSGWIKLTYDWDWSGAEQEIKRALELDPNSAAAHQLYGNYLLAMGHINEAIVEQQRARELDPLSLFVNRDLGRALYYGRRYDDALRQLKQTLELDSEFGGVVYEWISWCYEKKGMPDQAIDAFLRLDESGDRTHFRAREQLYKQRGWGTFWRGELQYGRNRVPGASDYFAVLDYARLGDKKNALALLRREIDLHTVWVTWINVDPELDSLRGDPRFNRLLRLTGR